MYYVYILFSKKDKKFYTGFSNDLKRRIDEHKKGKVKSTKNRRPLELVLYEGYTLKDDAKRRENFLKTSDGKRFLKQQLSSYVKRFATG